MKGFGHAHVFHVSKMVTLRYYKERYNLEYYSYMLNLSCTKTVICIILDMLKRVDNAMKWRPKSIVDIGIFVSIINSDYTLL